MTSCHLLLFDGFAFVYLPFLLIASLGPAVAQASGTHLVGNQYIFLKSGG